VSNRQKLIEQTKRDIARLIQKQKAPAGWVGILFYGGTLGLLFVTPIILGAYLGRWLDTLFEGYSVRWTVSLIVLGIVTGAYNAFKFIQRH
jgi:ATP synthase protein I